MQTILTWLLDAVRKIPFLDRAITSLLRIVDIRELLFIAHYGCPNSKRTARLQLKKRIL